MTDYLILDQNFVQTDVLDTYESSIWTDRYNKYGDVEIYTLANRSIFQKLKQDYYLIREDSEHAMVIEDVQIETNVETGNTVTIRGRSLESILDRRIVWYQIILDGNFQNQLKKLLNDNIIAPKDEKRKIANFVFRESTDPRITELEVHSQFTGDNIYDVVHELCLAVNIGFKIMLEEIEGQMSFVFQLYAGEDRSYDQNKLPAVAFSPNFDNIINSNYLSSKKPLKNVALVLGEGEGNKRKRQVSIPEDMSEETSGLIRRELYVDARDVSSDTESGTISAAKYNTLLKQRGIEKLAENLVTETFDGQVETTLMYRYQEHFFMGDVCQLENEYGMEEKVRITEFIFSESKSSGIENYPTFVVVGHEQEEG